MAGTISNGGVFWNVGDTSGRDDAGNTATLPVGPTHVGYGTATPTAAPAGAPLYVDTDNDDLFVWEENTWTGPYAKAT